MASGKRYKFQGSTFQVGTSYAAHKAITNITKAAPPILSVATHGYVLGDVVRVREVDGMIEMNGQVFPVDSPIAAGSFAGAGIDATGYTTFAAGSPQDARVEKVNFSNFCELTGANQQGGTTDEIDATTICSTAKEFETGLSDAGALTLDFNFAPNEVVQSAIRAAELAGDDLAFKLTLPGDGGIVILIGSVQQSSFQGAVGGLWTGSVTVKLTGQIFVLEA